MSGRGEPPGELCYNLQQLYLEPGRSPRCGPVRGLARLVGPRGPPGDPGSLRKARKPLSKGLGGMPVFSFFQEKPQIPRQMGGYPLDKGGRRPIYFQD